MKFKLVQFAAATLALGVSAAGALAQGGPPPATVRVGEVRREVVQEHRQVTGELRAVRRARVAAEEPGRVAELSVNEGSHVRAGDVIAKLDSTELEIELRGNEADEAVAVAAIEERKAELKWREMDLENVRKAMQSGGSNAKELYDAESEERIARTRLRVTELAVTTIRTKGDLLRRRIAETVITAPFDGVVIARLVELGEWISEGGEVVELVSSGPVDAWLDVPQHLAGSISTMQEGLTVHIEALSHDAASTSLRVVPLVDSRSRMFSVIARLANEEGSLSPGMSVNAWAPTGQKGTQLTVPKDALMRTATGFSVYVVRQMSPEGPAQAMPAEVQVLFAYGDRMVVRSSAVREGDQVVTEGNERLFPTAPVIPMVQGTPSQSAGQDVATGS